MDKWQHDMATYDNGDGTESPMLVLAENDAEYDASGRVENPDYGTVTGLVFRTDGTTEVVHVRPEVETDDPHAESKPQQPQSVADMSPAERAKLRADLDAADPPKPDPAASEPTPEPSVPEPTHTESENVL